MPQRYRAPTSIRHYTIMTHSPLMQRQPLRALGTLFASALVLHGCAGSGDNDKTPPESATAQLTILETTDLHANIVSYDYFKLAEDKSIGFERTATLIRQARQDYPNTVLIDNGDTIQGTALADYQALVNP